MGTRSGSSIPNTVSQTSAGVVVLGPPAVVVETISPSDVVLVVRGVVGAEVVVVGTVNVNHKGVMIVRQLAIHN